MELNDRELLDWLVTDKYEKALTYIYTLHREPFTVFAKRYTEDVDLITDVYQDAIVLFYENICRKKNFKGQSSLKTYLFAIGKYVLFARLKKKDLMVASSIEDFRMELHPVESDSERLESLLAAMELLDPKCRRLLTLFYFHSYSIDSLKQELGLKSENVVKVTKVRCMRKLKDLILKQWKKE